MSIKISDCLFSQKKDDFQKIENMANQILMNSPIFRLVGSNLITLVKKYANIRNIHLKILTLPLHDNQVWGLFYELKGIYFIVINGDISINKQNIALAHEFYHFIIALNDMNGLKLDVVKEDLEYSKTNEEDSRANAFGACLLMPSECIKMVIEKRPISLEDKIYCIKTLMDVFLVPYKTAVIRMYEIGYITETEADVYIKATDTEMRDKFESSKWQNQFKNYTDLDDLESLIKENEMYEFISAYKAKKQLDLVEEILKQIKEESDD